MIQISFNKDERNFNQFCLFFSRFSLFQFFPVAEDKGAIVLRVPRGPQDLGDHQDPLESRGWRVMKDLRAPLGLSDPRDRQHKLDLI